MATTTAVLLLAGTIIMLFSSTMRPEPEPPRNGITISFNEPSFNDQTFNEYIKTDLSAFVRDKNIFVADQLMEIIVLHRSIVYVKQKELE